MRKKTTASAENILTIRDILKIRDFRLIVLAQATSDFGSSLTNLALLIFVNNATQIVISQGFSGVAADIIGVREMFIVISIISIIGGLTAGLIYSGFGSFLQKTTLPKGKI